MCVCGEMNQERVLSGSHSQTGRCYTTLKHMHMIVESITGNYMKQPCILCLVSECHEVHHLEWVLSVQVCLGA